jgi:hypothetical protein
MSFSREKPYGSGEDTATYELRLSVLFGGQSRDADLSPAIDKSMKEWF